MLSLSGDELFWDHLALLREKIGVLRAEIAQLQELNDRYWLRRGNDTQAQVAHGKRQERLLEIQQELTQISRLSGLVRSVTQMTEQHRSRPFPMKRAS